MGRLKEDLESRRSSKTSISNLTNTMAARIFPIGILYFSLYLRWLRGCYEKQGQGWGSQGPPEEAPQEPLEPQQQQ